MRKLILTLLVISVAATTFGQAVKGKVTDSKGSPLPGATILSADNGVFSNGEGNYQISFTGAGEYEITCSFIGFEEQNKKVTLADGEVLNLDFRLKDDSYLLDDVVVVGYGVQRRRAVTGSIEKIDSEQITSLPVPSIEAALQGQAAGVQVSQGSGLAGSGSLIRIRGISSVSAGGDPLYVIDGIPVTQDQFLFGNTNALNNNPLATINPQDVESIEVLKDAAATAIYGSRGANGVIIITTKRGKEKGVQFDFTTRVGISTPATLPNMLNSEQYLRLRQEAWENDGGTGYVWLPTYSTADDDAETRRNAYLAASEVDTDWVDETIGQGFKQLYSMSARKGGELVDGFFNVTYDDNQSFFMNNRYERVSGRMNLDFKLGDRLELSINESISQGRNYKVDAAWSGGLGDAMSHALPIYPVLDSAGNYNLFNESDFGWRIANPVALANQKNIIVTENRWITGLKMTYQPIDNLFINLNGNYEYYDAKEDGYSSGVLTPGADADFLGNSWRNNGYVNNYNTSATANYLHDKGTDHAWNFMIGTEYQRSRYLSTNQWANDVSGSFLDVVSYPDSIESGKDSNNPVFWAFISGFGRINYAFKDKYFFQLTSRTDGSSRFGSNNRYATFPSISAGWIMSEEGFLVENRTISFLKLRGSFGYTGNAGIDASARFALYEDSQSLTYNGKPIIFPTQLGNEDLRWETARVIDASLEFGLWDDRVSGKVEAYHKLAKDVLLQVGVSPSTGFSSYWDNVAEVVNRGLEFSIQTINISTKDFTWITNFNMARNYNELNNIGGYTPDAVSGGTNDSRVVPGKPVGSFYLVPFSHIDDESGRPVYIDADGNNTFDYDFVNDRQYVGDGLPDFIGGMTNTVTYKQWTVSALLNFSKGAKIFDSSAKRQMGVVTGWNMREDALDRWTQPGDDATYPVLTLDGANWGIEESTPWLNTDLYVYDADYLRVKNLTLAYMVPDFMIRKRNITRMTFTAGVTNAFLWTNFPGLDPEVVRDFENQQDRNLSGNVTFLTPPQERAFTLQWSFSF